MIHMKLAHCANRILRRSVPDTYTAIRNTTFVLTNRVNNTNNINYEVDHTTLLFYIQY